jgi:hypothetical protein
MHRVSYGLISNLNKNSANTGDNAKLSFVEEKVKNAVVILEDSHSPRVLTHTDIIDIVQQYQ